jgi:hypothetical protein
MPARQTVEDFMRFTIRDLLWLTVAAALSLGWWRCWHSIQRTEGTMRGFFCVSGKPVHEGRILVHFEDGQFRGTNVVDGRFLLEHVPLGEYRVTFEGKDVPKNRFMIAVDTDNGMTYDVRPSIRASAATVAGAAEPFVR